MHAYVNTALHAGTMSVQLDGITQTANTLNFIGNNVLLEDGVLNLSRQMFYDKIPLIYDTSTSIKDLSQGVGGELLWNGVALQMAGAGATKTLQLDGVTQTAGTLDFIGDNALLEDGVLNVSRLAFYYNP
jgi:hypothetical protein